MSPILSERARRKLSQSLPLVQAHKQEIIDRLDAALVRAESDCEPTPSAIDAKVLFQALVGQVRHRLGMGDHAVRSQPLPLITAHPAARRTYSQFADALVPILKDALGPDVPQAAPAAWNQAFWDLVRAESVELDRKAA